jgi:hypothetical protein
MSQNAARFVYQLTIRPAGPDTTPVGIGRDFHDADVLPTGRNHGSVSYAEPLTVEQIAHYSLIPVTQMQALNGQCFTESWLGRPDHEAISHRVRLSESLMALQIDSECEGVKHSECLSYPDFIKRSTGWTAA